MKEKKLSDTRSRLKSTYFIIACAIECIILVSLIFTCCSIAKNPETVDVSLAKFKSDYIEYSDNAWSADSKSVKTSDTVELIYSPYINLKPGSYVVTIDYKCSSEQTATVTIDSNKSSFLKSGTAKLYKTLTSTSFRIDVTESTNKGKIIVNYSGSGSIKITGISIHKDYANFGRAFTWLLILFLICDIIYLFFDQIKENKNTLLLLLGIILLTSLPVLIKGIGRGHDIEVHLVRIEGIAQEIRNGNIPVRLSSFWMEGYGYPISIYYGDILLYFPALLRIIGFNVVTAYKAYILLINIGTVVIGYFSFKGIFKNNNLAILSTLVYCTASYRLINLYIRSAVGEFSAMMFLPLIALSLYRIYADDIEDWKAYSKNALLLALGMTGLIGNHMLSTEMVIFILVLICIVLIKKTFRWNTLKVFCLAVFETLLLNAYYIVPFLDYYRNVNVKISNLISGDSIDMIQKQGCGIAEYFSFFRDPFSEFSQSRNHRMVLTPGLVLMLALIVGIYIAATKLQGKKRKEMAFFAGFSVFILFVASDIFPWDTLALNSGIGKMLSQVQFPWRYIGIAIIFLTVLLGIIINYISETDSEKSLKYMKIIALLCVITTTYFTGAYLDDRNTKQYYDSADLKTSAVGMGEYIRVGSNKSSINGKISAKNMETVELLERNGCHMELYCESSGKDGTVEVPIFNYKGYVVKDDKGNTYDISDGENNVVKFTLPKNFKGNITIDFVEPWYWRASEVVTLLTIIGFFVLKKYPQLIAPKKKTKK